MNDLTPSDFSPSLITKRKRHTYVRAATRFNGGADDAKSGFSANMSIINQALPLFEFEDNFDFQKWQLYEYTQKLEFGYDIGQIEKFFVEDYPYVRIKNHVV